MGDPLKNAGRRIAPVPLKFDFEVEGMGGAYTGDPTHRRPANYITQNQAELQSKFPPAVTGYYNTPVGDLTSGQVPEQPPKPNWFEQGVVSTGLNLLTGVPTPEGGRQRSGLSTVTGPPTESVLKTLERSTGLTEAMFTLGQLGANKWLNEPLRTGEETKAFGIEGIEGWGRYNPKSLESMKSFWNGEITRGEMLDLLAFNTQERPFFEQLLLDVLNPTDILIGGSAISAVAKRVIPPLPSRFIGTAAYQAEMIPMHKVLDNLFKSTMKEVLAASLESPAIVAARWSIAPPAFPKVGVARQTRQRLGTIYKGMSPEQVPVGSTPLLFPKVRPPSSPVLLTGIRQLDAPDLLPFTNAMDEAIANGFDLPHAALEALASEGVVAIPPSVLESMSPNPGTVIAHPNYVLPDGVTYFYEQAQGQLFAGGYSLKLSTGMPRTTGALVTYEAPNIVRDLLGAFLTRDKANMLGVVASTEQRKQLKDFLLKYGVAPFDDLHIGSIEFVDGERMHIVGAYDDPLFQGNRMYIAYNPRNHSFMSHANYGGASVLDLSQEGALMRPGQGAGKAKMSAHRYMVNETLEAQGVLDFFYGDLMKDISTGGVRLERVAPDVPAVIDPVLFPLPGRVTGVPGTLPLAEEYTEFAAKRAAVEAGQEVEAWKPGGIVPTTDPTGLPKSARWRIASQMPGESPGDASIREHQGLINTQLTELRRWREAGNAMLSELGIGRKVGKHYVVTRDEGLLLGRAMHDPGVKLPPEQEPIRAYARQRVIIEEQRHVAFDPEFQGALDAIPNYFSRAWKNPEEVKALNEGRQRPTRTPSGGTTKNPGFQKARIDASYDELINEGWEPLSWNIFDQWAIREMEGILHRQNVVLLERLKKHGLAVGEDEILKANIGDTYKGWRVPRSVGAVWDGLETKLPGSTEVVAGRKHYVDPTIAGELETIFGYLEPDLVLNIKGTLGPMKVPTVDFGKYLDNVTMAARRLLFVMSGFQHWDILTRGGGATMAASKNVVRNSWKAASLVGNIMKVTIVPGSSIRKSIQGVVMSGEALYDDFPISIKMVSEMGANLTQGDIAFRGVIVDTFMKELQREVASGTKVAIARVANLYGWWESNLFEGVYTHAQVSALINTIIPKTRRKYPDWTPQQVAAAAADEVNIMFSTPGVWQTIFSDPNTMRWAKRLILSPTEAETWIRMGVRTLKGDRKALWAQHWVGMGVFLAMVANLTHASSQREPLPLDRYSPLRKSDGIIPFEYNPLFLAPTAPWKARNGAESYLDIVGQADSLFGMVLNPPWESVGARIAPVVGQVSQQLRNLTWTGEQIADPEDPILRQLGDRATHFAMGFAPAGVQSAIRGATAAGVPGTGGISEHEQRAGAAGLLGQASGINVRTEDTKSLLNKQAAASGLLVLHGPNKGAPIKEWDELEPHQKSIVYDSFPPNIQAELDMRTAEHANKDNQGAQFSIHIKALGEAALEQEADAVYKFEHGHISNGWELLRVIGEITDNRVSRISAYDLAYEDVKLRDKAPEDEYKKALFDYYAVFERARKETSIPTKLDYAGTNKTIAELKATWTPDQQSYVERNTGLTEHHPTIQEFLDDVEKIHNYLYVMDVIRVPVGIQNDLDIATALTPKAQWPRHLIAWDKRIRRTREAMWRGVPETQRILIKWRFRRRP